MNPILMEEQDRRLPPNQQLYRSQQPPPRASQSQSWRPSSSLNGSGNKQMQLQPPIHPPLTVQERQQVEEARDSLASGIRVANKTLGGLMDMQEWRQYASNIMGQQVTSDLSAGGTEVKGVGSSAPENEKSNTKESQLNLQAVEKETEQRNKDFLRATLSPEVLQALSKEAEEEDALRRSTSEGSSRGGGQSALAALQKAMKNLRFLIEYDDSFMDHSHDQNQGRGQDFDGALYNKLIDNTIGLLTKRFPRSGVVRALDECFGVLESFIAKNEVEPFKSMQLPSYAVNGGVTNHLEKGVLPKLSGLKTFNMGMMVSDADQGSVSQVEQPQSQQGILSSFQLEQVNKRILSNVQQDLLPVLQLLADLRCMADPTFDLDPGQSGELVASTIRDMHLRSSQNKKGKHSSSTSSPLVGGLSAEYTPGELRLSSSTPLQESDGALHKDGAQHEPHPPASKSRRDGNRRAWTSSSKLRRSSTLHSTHVPDDDEDEDDYDDNDYDDDYEDEEEESSMYGHHEVDLSPYGEDIERQVVEGREEAAQVYESWVQVKLLLQSVACESGALTEEAAAELQREVSQWYRHYIASGQVSGKPPQAVRDRGRYRGRGRDDRDAVRGRSRSPRRRGEERTRSTSGDIQLPLDDSSEDAMFLNEENTLKKTRQTRSGQLVEMKKNGTKSQIYIPREKHRQPGGTDSIEDIKAALENSDSEQETVLRAKLAEQMQVEAQKTQQLLEEQKAEKARLAAEIERKEFEKISTEEQLEKQKKAHAKKVLKGVDRIRRRIFTHFLSRRFRTWQLFTQRLRAHSLVLKMQAQQKQLSAEEREKAAREEREKEAKREEILRRERELAEAAARERAAQADENLRNLLEQQKLRDNELLEQRVQEITQEKERLLEEERRMSSAARTLLLEERDKLLEIERNKEVDLTQQIQSLVATNDNLSIQNEKKLKVLKLLSNMGDRLDRAVKISFSTWVQFCNYQRNQSIAKKERKKTIKRMLRILLGVHKESVKDALRRAFRLWERASSAERYLSSISSSEAETIAGLRGRVNILQEELLALTTQQEGAASWVAERALNRELSASNHDLEQRFSALQTRLLEVARVPQAERKQLVNAVLLDREQEVARSRKEIRVLREQVAVLEKYLRIPMTDRPSLSPKSSKEPATDNTNGIMKVQDNRSKNQDEDNDFYEHSSTSQSKFYRQKFQIAGKMTKQDALQVVLGEMQHLQKVNAGLKEDNARKGTELAEETSQHHELSLSLGVLQHRLLNKERRLDLLQKELTKLIGSTEVALILDSPLVK